MRNNLFLLVILCSSRTCLLAEELLYVLLSFSVSMLVTLTGCCRLRRRHFQCLLVSLPAWLFLLSFAAFDCNFSRCTDVIEHQKGCFPPPSLSLFLPFFQFSNKCNEIQLRHWHPIFVRIHSFILFVFVCVSSSMFFTFCLVVVYGKLVHESRQNQMKSGARAKTKIVNNINYARLSCNTLSIDGVMVIRR